MKDLVGDLLHVADLIPEISGVVRVSTVTSLPGLGGSNRENIRISDIFTWGRGTDQNDLLVQGSMIEEK